MSVDAVAPDEFSVWGNFESDETEWNGREVQSIGVCSDSIEAVSLIANKATRTNFPIDHYSYPVGECARKHPAYHVYHQTSNPPIYLCEWKQDPCPFEYYRFLAFLRGEISYMKKMMKAR